MAEKRNGYGVSLIQNAIGDGKMMIELFIQVGTADGTELNRAARLFRADEAVKLAGDLLDFARTILGEEERG